MATGDMGKPLPSIDIIVSLCCRGLLALMIVGCSVESSENTPVKTTARADAATKEGPNRSSPIVACRVLFFVRVDCPISNRYAPRMESMWQQYRDRGVEFSLVYPDPQMTADAIKNHRQEYKLTIPSLHDPQHQWVQQARATITPEVGLFDAHGNLVYHGRIDNQYDDLGRYRAEPTEHTLRDAIESLLSGESVAAGYRPAVGCLISDLRPTASDEP